MKTMALLQKSFFCSLNTKGNNSLPSKYHITETMNPNPIFVSSKLNWDPNWSPAAAILRIPVSTNRPVKINRFISMVCS